MTRTLLLREIKVKVADKLGLPDYLVGKVIGLFVDEVCNALCSGRNASLGRLGKLKIRRRAERVARNPRRPAEEYIIPEHLWVIFRMSKAFKRDVLSMPVSAPESVVKAVETRHQPE